MEIDWEKANAEALEELQREYPDAVITKAELWELQYSGRKRRLQGYLRDGIKINVSLLLYDGIPKFYITHLYDDVTDYFELWATPEIEQFILYYLCTGKATGAPKLYLEREDITFRADEDYIYRHLRREIERNAEIETTEDEQGTRVTAHYPYGTISYGVLPHSIEILDSILNGIENYSIIPEYDIQKLHSDNLPIKPKPILEGKYLDSVYPNGIPSNIILDKTICGIGATYLEIEKAQRHSIIIEPNVPVIIGKEKDHPQQIIGVYGEMNVKEIRARIEEKIETEYLKILTTPESFKKVINALKSFRIPYRDNFFLLFDECDRIITDIDFRERIALPMEEFFQFTNKAMVSATPIIIDDQRFKEHDFRVIKIKPDYYYAKPLELKPTNNVSLLLKRTLAKLETETKFCIFYNYVKGITDLIEYLELLPEEVSIYCSESARKDFKNEEIKSNVFDNLKYNEDNTVNLTTKYNFFTSRYYSAVDIKLNEKPTVIMLSDVYKVFPKEAVNKDRKKKRKTKADEFIPTETPFTLIEPETEAIQIAGRFRNGISRLIHITNTNSEMEWKSKENLEKFYKEQHSAYLKLKEVRENFTELGEKYFANQAITRPDYVKDGYVTDKDEINHFRYNNMYLDERLKMLYYYPAMLYEAYSNSKAFYILSQSEYCAYTEQELKAIKNTNTLKAKRFQLLNEMLPKLAKSLHSDDHQLLEELKNELAFYFEALTIIGYRRIRQLQFLDSAIKEEIFKKKLTAKKVVKEVYSIFKEEEKYPTAFINTELERIFNKYNICLGRRIQAKDIENYFEAKEYRTRDERGWKMVRKLIN